MYEISIYNILGDVNKINSSTNPLKKPNVIDVTRQDVQDREGNITYFIVEFHTYYKNPINSEPTPNRNNRSILIVEITTCPDTHKYAYANGDWCCKWNKDGNKRYISLASGSCQNIDFNTDFWECPEGKSCRNHPSGKKSSDYFVCSSLKVLSPSKDSSRE